MFDPHSWNAWPDDRDWTPVQRVRELSTRMVGWQSVSGSAGEAEFAGRLRDLLGEIPYFRDNPGDLVLLESHGDPVTCNLVAIVRGSGARALAMAGHYDTASLANYHDLVPLACDPDALHTALLADLAARPLSEQEAQALDDLRGGDFLPGRGLLDMKCGIAAGIAVLERFAATPDRQGNLILFASPDEERESRGMRALREALPALMEERGLTIEAAINLDATSDQGDGALGRAVYEGTIGKALPFAFVLGQSSHAAYPFEGISAQLIGAEILRAIEGNAALSDTGPGDVSPPPICLEARDLREGYEVTTPERFWLSFNWLYHSGSAADRLDKFRAEVEAALGRATERFGTQAAAFARASGARPGAAMAAPRVMTLAELKAQALPGPEASAAFLTYQASLSAVDNPLVLSRLLTEWLAEAAHLTGPLVVIGFAGLNYPPSRIDPEDPRAAELSAAIRAACAGMAPGEALCHRPHFQGISDMSFLGQPRQQGAEAVADNTPAARLIDRPGPDALSFPAVNIGPWGREFHQRLERVHMPYAFGTLPGVLARVAGTFLRDAPER